MKMKIAPTALCLLLMLVIVFPITAQQEKTAASWVSVAPDDMPTHVVKVLRTTNKAQINQYVAKVFDFYDVNPHEIDNFIANGQITS